MPSNSAEHNIYGNPPASNPTSHPWFLCSDVQLPVVHNMAARTRSASTASLEVPRRSTEIQDPGAHDLGTYQKSSLQTAMT